jgi:hypothetical protein
MPNLLLVNSFDAARSLGQNPSRATPVSVRDWFLEYYVPVRGGRFNYDPASRATFDLFRGVATAKNAEDYCLANGNPKGRKQNASAVNCISEYAINNVSTCYPTGFAAVEVGRTHGKTVYIGIKSPFVRVVHDEALVVQPFYRTGFRPTGAEIDTVCGVALAHFARDDFANADIELICAGPDGRGGRELQIIRGKDRDLPSVDVLDSYMDTYVKGIGLLLNHGVDSRPPNFRGYRIFNSDQPGFF